MKIKKMTNSEKSTEQSKVSLKKIKIGVAIPMSTMGECSKSHWDEVYKIIESSFDKEAYDISIVSKSNEVAIIQSAIVNNLYHNDIVICDVSCGNPNVMFELGMRLAFDKPTIVIKDIETAYSFDSSPIRHIEYPRSLHYQSIIEFKGKIKTAVEKTLEATKKDGYSSFLSNFGDLKAAKVEDRVVPENEYIIKRLDSIFDRLDRLEKNNGSSLDSIYSGVLSGDELYGHIAHLIDKYCHEKNLNIAYDKDLARVVEQEIRSYVLEHLSGPFSQGSTISVLPCRGSTFDATFQKAYHDAIHPF